MIPIKPEFKEYGFYLLYDGTPPQGTIVDEVGGVGRDRFPDLQSAIEAVRDLDLIDDFQDVVLFYGINTDDIMVVLPPFGYMMGQDFVSGA